MPENKIFSSREIYFDNKCENTFGKKNKSFLKELIYIESILKKC